MKISKQRLKQIIEEELGQLQREVDEREFEPHRPVREGKKWWAVDTELIDRRTHFVEAHTPEQVREEVEDRLRHREEIVKISKQAPPHYPPKSMNIGEELGERQGDLDPPARQEYDALTSMISRLDGMESFLLNVTRRKSDENLTQQAAVELNKFRDILSQLRRNL